MIPGLLYLSGPCEMQGLITFNKFPRLGRQCDTEGIEWDVFGIVGKTVNAAKVSELENWVGDTSGFGSSCVATAPDNWQSYKPYDFKIV